MLFRNDKMTPNPMKEGALVAVEEKGERQRKFTCIFNDKTDVSESQKKFHINLNGNCTVKEIYQTVAEKKHYIKDTFLLSFLEYGDYGPEIDIDTESSKVLSDLIGHLNCKCYQFQILQKNGLDPSFTGVTTVAVQVSLILSLSQNYAFFYHYHLYISSQVLKSVSV